LNDVERYRDPLLDSIIVFAILLVIAMLVLTATLLLSLLLETKQLEKRRELLSRALFSLYFTVFQIWNTH
jgi:hypothetical protein